MEQVLTVEWASLGRNILLLRALKSFTVGIGVALTFFGWRAFRATGKRAMLWLTVGFSLSTIGVIAEGLAYQGFGATLEEAHLVEGVATLVAFGVLFYSLLA